MKSNDDKCHLIVVNNDNAVLKLGNENLAACKSVELLGVKIDNNLDFKEHVTKLCKKGSQKLHALARISKYLDKEKLRLLMRAFVNSRFNSCPLIWMFHNRTLNNKINKLREKALRLVYKNDDLSFQELLDADLSETIHEKNLKRLAIEMFKVKIKIAPLPIQELFAEHINLHDLRKKRSLDVSKVNTAHFGTETIRFRGPKTWEMLPSEIQESKSLQEFKAKIKR